MRLPFPTSIPMMQALPIFGVLLAVQLLEGTDPSFAVLMLIAQVFAVLAFNALGGMSHVAGSFCMFSLLPNVTVPEIAHAIVGQPGDYHILAPLKTAAVCAVFYASLYAAAKFAVMLPHPPPLLDRVQFSLTELRAVSALSAILSLFIAIAVLFSGGVQDGTTLAAIQHFYPLLNPLSVIAATYVRLSSTLRRSAMSWYVAVILAAGIIPGVLSASKEGMLTPMLCWLLVCGARRYRFTRRQVAVLAGFILVAWFFVYPYSQNARDVVHAAKSFPERIAVIVAYFRNPSIVEDTTSNVDPDASEFGESSSKLSIVQRFSLLNSAGMLINADQTEGFTGIERYFPAFFSIVPHFVWPDRPVAVASNELGHKAGFKMGRDDTTTGIAISSPALFYDVGGWLGLPVYTMLDFLFYFYVLRSIFGTATRSVWGLMMIGATAYASGVFFPSTPIVMIEVFLTAFAVLVGCLKIVAYLSESLFSRPVMQEH
jgi:hypothetical protein